MTQDNLARDLSADAEACDDAIYEALVAALRSHPRGRAFLDEFARRSRAADTAAALAALARIEALITREQTVDRAAVEVREIHPDDAFVPFEFDLLPDLTVDDPAATEGPLPKRPSAELLTQVMALSPEERIALFS